MNLWQRFEIRNRPSFPDQGISFRYEAGIDPALRELYIRFAKWLRKTYVFPVHVRVSVLNRERVRLKNGADAYGSFRWYPRRPPNIRIPSKIEPHLYAQFSMEELYEQVLSSLVHELTHYYQWYLDLEQSNAVSERQANHYRYRIIHRFHKETA